MHLTLIYPPVYITQTYVIYVYMTHVYITHSSYNAEMVMFKAASLKLGLDYAVMHNLNTSTTAQVSIHTMTLCTTVYT